MTEKAATTITYSQEVSGGDRTLQYFDFLSQTLEQMLSVDGVDRSLLCNLLITQATSRQFAPLMPSVGRLGQ